MDPLPDAFDSNLLDAMEAIEGLNVCCWISGGTLLGIVRDNKLLDWDRDIDISILATDVDPRRIVRQMREFGFSLRYNSNPLDNLQFVKGDGRKVDINLCRRLGSPDGVLVSNVWCDDRHLSWYAKMPRKAIGCVYTKLIAASLPRLALLREVVTIAFGGLGALHRKLDALFKVPTRGYFVPEQYVLPTTSICFAGTKMRAPSDWTNFLAQIYGDNWRVPEVSEHWTRYTRTPKEVGVKWLN